MKKLAIVVTLSILVVGFVGLNLARSGGEEIVPVKTAEVVQEDIKVSVFATGRAGVDRMEKIFARVSGMVEEVLVEPGDEVREGQVLVRLDSGDLSRRLKEAQASLAVQEANYEKARLGPREKEVNQYRIAVSQAELALEDARRALERTEELYGGGAASGQELENARKAVALRELELQQTRDKLAVITAGERPEVLKSLRAQVEQARLSVKLLEEQMEGTTVRAGIDGTVLAVHVEEGQYVTTGAPVVQVGDLGTLVIVAEVNEADAGKLRPGQSVEITGSAFIDTRYSGRVSKVAPAAQVVGTGQGQETSVDVEVEVLDKDNLIKPGYSADLNITVASKEGALLVPYEAVVKEDGKDYIFLVRDERAVKRQVTIGLKNDLYLEVSEGVEAGDTIVLNPPEDLEDETRVNRVAQK